MNIGARPVAWLLATAIAIGYLAGQWATREGRDSAVAAPVARTDGGPGADAGVPALSGTDPEHEFGRKVYNFRCYFCHGYSGDARTVAAAVLEPRPRSFRDAASAALTPQTIAQTLREGRPGTAMKAFAGVLDARELDAVARFVHREFVVARASNTRYHTAGNGWPDHERYAAAFPFATGEIAADAPWDTLSPEQARGRRLYLTACITCHDRPQDSAPSAHWNLRAVSYPPNASACSSCHNRGPAAPANHATQPAFSATYVDRRKPTDPQDPHELHDRAPRIAGLSTMERRGETVYQANCAFCHAADGTGRNWIGAFLEPHPANFTDPAVMGAMTRERLMQTIREGKPGSSMPAWQSVLAPADIAAVAAYIGKAFHPLAGAVAGR